MSHFTVLVVGADPEEQLVPFQENNMGNCPVEFLKFFETETENTEEYENKSVTRVQMPDGRLLSTYDDEFKLPGAIGLGTRTHEVPAHLPQIEVPLKDLYSDFDTFMREYCGYEEKDPKTGQYGYWENPNAKWDWYQLGGRWAGFFKLKPDLGKDIECNRGEPSWWNGDTPIPFDQVDQAYKKDIDWAAMSRKKNEEAAEIWEKWEALLDKFGGEEGFKNADAKAYHAETGERLPSAYFDFGIHWNPDEERYDTREEFIIRRQLSTFAVLKDGVWYQKGEMGWWGAVREAMSEREWKEKWTEMVQELDEDTLLSVYDCHI
jgi:hypothetical protein